MHFRWMLALVMLILAEKGRALQVFSPSAFTIRRQVGQLGFATETEWQYGGGQRNPLDPTQPARTVEVSGISVRLFEALLDSGERILLKEFLNPARDIGERELAVHEHLQARSQETGQTLKGSTLLVNTLLGLLRTTQLFETDAFRQEWAKALPNTPPPSADELWLIFKWEGLTTIGGFPRAQQQRAWFDFDGRGFRTARKRFLKVLVARCLQVIASLHESGVVHRSIGTSSLILSTYEQDAPERLFVKAIDLGFATTASLLSSEDIGRAMGRGALGPLDVLPLLMRDDLHSLAYALLEVILSAAASTEQAATPDGPPTDLQSLKRLVEDVFEGDVLTQVRAYVCEEPRWSLAVELLDENEQAGWNLMQQLVDCRDPASEAARQVSARRLLDSSWFKE